MRGEISGTVNQQVDRHLEVLKIEDTRRSGTSTDPALHLPPAG
jgi:hypothetical protein